MSGDRVTVADLEAQLDGIQKLFDRELERRVRARAEYDQKVDTAVAAIAKLGDAVATLQNQGSELSDLADEVHKMAERLNPSNNAPRGRGGSHV